jgi:hypothetical protein
MPLMRMGIRMFRLGRRRSDWRLLAKLPFVCACRVSHCARGEAVFHFNALERVGNCLKHRGKLNKHLHIVFIIRHHGCQMIVFCSSEESDRCDVFEWANFGRRVHWDLPVSRCLPTGARRAHAPYFSPVAIRVMTSPVRLGHSTSRHAELF